jgi:hypothetical protein
VIFSFFMVTYLSAMNKKVNIAPPANERKLVQYSQSTLYKSTKRTHNRNAAVMAWSMTRSMNGTNHRREGSLL